MECNKTIYRNVKTLVKIRGIHLSDIEKECGMSIGYLSRGKNLSSLHLIKLSEIFGVSIDDLLKKDLTSSFRSDELIQKLEKTLGKNCSKEEVESLMKPIRLAVYDYFADVEG